MKAVTLIFLTLCIIAVFSLAATDDQPQPNLSFKPNQTQQAQQQSYSALMHLAQDELPHTHRNCLKKGLSVTNSDILLLSRYLSYTVAFYATQFSYNNTSSNLTQDAASSCRYTVTIKTSCNSPKYTRDRISLSFGDAYGYQVYVPRLDDPSSRTFERCSTDTFDVYGPCTYQICYLYLYRTGYDGWKPESVTVYTYNYPPASFYYNAFIPSGIWYGFDFCRGYLPSTASA